MYKSVRLIAFAFLFTIASVPSMKADRWGTNPVPTSPTVVDTMQDAVMFNLGMM